MNRKFRLTGASNFQRVRRFGKSTAHPLIVLIALPNKRQTSRFAVAAGRSIGNAVQRNRARRRLREALRPLIPAISPGWDVLLLARKPINQAVFQQLRQALGRLLQRARLLQIPYDE